MKKGIKIISAALIVLELTSCNSVKKVKEKVGIDEDKVLDTAKEVAEALVDRDMNRLEKNCSGGIDTLKEAVPFANDATSRKDEVIIKSMIASTLEYEIDEKSLDVSASGKKCSVDVEFSYLDYNKVFDEKTEFFDNEEFGEYLSQVKDLVTVDVTFEFRKKGDDILLTNADEFTPIYDYQGIEINYIDLFDFAGDIYMVGDNWDPELDGYVYTNTFEMVVEIKEEGRAYDWTYKYRIAQGILPDLTNIYVSDFIVEETPTEIRVKFTQEENFKEGDYSILLYDEEKSHIIGYEFSVFQSE